jgi:plastocyanin
VKRSLVRAMVLLSGWVALVGCGDGDGSGPAPPTPSTTSSSASPSNSSSPSGSASPNRANAEVAVQNFAFSPASITVPVGGTVTWRFVDSTQHNVTADNQSFKSSNLANGQNFTMTFDTAGTFPYTCTIHPFMKGTVTVR